MTSLAPAHSAGAFYFPIAILIKFDIVLTPAGLAQLVEQFIYTEKVGGSSPSSRTKKKPPYEVVLL
ncbi:MAG: hypothetical protein K0S38_769 [Candidatus Paceibacter sp.]|nr:hypothetical protein [Candidatus Paceibacter sp.]